MKKLLYILLCFISMHASAQYANGKIKVYFNRPVDTAVAGTYPAVFLNGTWADTLCAYINRAKYSIDVAQYDYSYTSTVADIATAINNAYSRGVTVRWIYNGSSSNTALSNLNGSIPTLASPTSSAYNIMHDKFVIIDANSSDTLDPIVWTGSCDWSQEMVDSDVNNIIIFQDKPFAQAYTAQFNQMWGGPGATPVAANEKFGPFKADLGPHIFSIGGSEVELYFSPTDSTDNHIIDVINSATSQLFFGVYDLTMDDDATAIVARKNAGVSVAGVVDQYTVQTGGTAYTTLTSGIGSMMKVYTESYSLYHNKYVLTDPCDLNADPKVLTGSHNWTYSANTKNDENTVVVHNPDVANLYYQAFYENFISLGGSLSACYASGACSGAINATADVNDNVVCYGESTGMATVNVHGPHGPFTYLWNSSPAQTDSVLNGVPAGTYTVAITDTSGCISQVSVTISQPSQMHFILSTGNPTNGQNNGSVTVLSLTGGVSPYTVTWSNGETGDKDTAIGPGTYVVTAVDHNGCSFSDTVVLTNVNGIGNIADGPQFKIYPDPASTLVNIDIENSISQAIVIIKDMIGQTLMTIPVSVAHSTLDLSGFGDGVYYISLDMGSGMSLRKLVISH